MYSSDGLPIVKPALKVFIQDISVKRLNSSFTRNRCTWEMRNGLEMRLKILWETLCAWNVAEAMMRTTSCCVMVCFHTTK